MKITELHRLFLQNKGVSTDTRKIEENSIFFALKGENFDGNLFAIQAMEKGASFAVVDKIVTPHEGLIKVDDVLQTLQKLANFHKKYLNIPVIALTGSNGKTTTKELINAVLSKKFKTVATKGNLNNHIGVPLTLLSMDSSTEIGIVEMGANHLGEIASLCEIAQPDYGYITNFGKAHLEGFGGIEGVIKGKSELYNFLKEKEKTIFINSDDAVQIRQAQGAKTYTFGENSAADYPVHFLSTDPFVKMTFENSTVQSQLIGKYNASNIAAAIAIGAYFEVPLSKITNGIEKYVPANNRSQIIEKGTNRILLDAYNANPTSMAAALENFNGLKSDKEKALILGDMFEVGEHSRREHQEIVNTLKPLNFKEIFLCGENFSLTIEGPKITKRFRTFEDLKHYLSEHPILNSFLLIKGSRGMRLERVLEII
ncbi:MAG TPA: UDP-N-acetylmuramoyl-tripeptide--D-alanyl-D-alanine ligase [Flavobacteriaceae bacterium]|nr:UDP-N-acetylmuramoyl-tripeptide--D-alanyl-D-alanine ligase [Flavobacteriaceae bacterium]